MLLRFDLTGSGESPLACASVQSHNLDQMNGVSVAGQAFSKQKVVSLAQCPLCASIVRGGSSDGSCHSHDESPRRALLDHQSGAARRCAPSILPRNPTEGGAH